MLAEGGLGDGEVALDRPYRRSEGDAWTEVATKLSRFGCWEFEDSGPHPR
jgi:hypothetical protein